MRGREGERGEKSQSCDAENTLVSPYVVIGWERRRERERQERREKGERGERERRGKERSNSSQFPSLPPSLCLPP